MTTNTNTDSQASTTSSTTNDKTMTTTTTTTTPTSLLPPKPKEHKESMWKQLLHVDELVAAVYLLAANPIPQENLSTLSPELTFCNDILGKVARPYAAAIRQLPRSTAINVMILHHALRALDTIEDDMTAFDKPNDKVKLSLLTNFVDTALTDPTWNLQGIGEGDEAGLLQEFPKCHAVFRTLSKEAQDIIKDITHRMAVGMVQFIQDCNFQGPLDLKQYNQYCHYVAGLVAEGLIRLFVLDGLERPLTLEPPRLQLTDHVGLFLQKVNIIRDFLEDYQEGRVFWPKSVWSQYVDSLEELALPCQRDDAKAVACLNHLVTDALQELPKVLQFLSQFQCLETYRFFALLQLGALGTLVQCYNNPHLFTGKVRMRKGLACHLALAGHEPDAVQEYFGIFASQIQQVALTLLPSSSTSNTNNNDVNNQTIQICHEIMALTRPAQKRRQATRTWQWTGMIMFCAFFCVALWCLYHFAVEQQPPPLPSWTMAVQSLFIAAALSGIHYGIITSSLFEFESSPVKPNNNHNATATKMTTAMTKNKANNSMMNESQLQLQSQPQQQQLRSASSILLSMSS